MWIEEAVRPGILLNPKKKNTPEAVSGFETLDDPASISHRYIVSKSIQ